MKDWPIKFTNILSNNKFPVSRMYNDKVGRYAVAKREIKKGELIFVEKPYAFVPVHDGSKRITNVDCENCGLTNIIPFLCSDCSRASYCSPSCCADHMKIHKFECFGYKKNLWYQIGIASLSLRTILTGISMLCNKINGLDKKQFKNQPEKIFKHLNEICGKNYNNYFDSDVEKSDEFQPYGQVFGLCTNFFKEDYVIMKTFHYAITSLLITSYLEKHTTFFEEFTVKDILKKDQWKAFVTAVLLRHSGQLVANGHSIIDFRQNIYQMDGPVLIHSKTDIRPRNLHLLLKSSRMFTGIFPKISILNHSCNPNIRNVFEKNQLSIYATKDLKENDEIFNCYGPHFKLMPLEERKECLKMQYCFDCNCEKCLNKDDFYVSFSSNLFCANL